MRILTLLLFVFICACEKEAELDIPNEKMAAAVEDMIIAEIGITRFLTNEKDSIRQLYYNQIYEIHGLDSTTFKRNLTILTENPKLAVIIYDLAEKALEKRKTDINKEK